MKRIIVILIASVCFVFSCNESEWLEEKPLDFYAADNSFQTEADFNAAIARLYEEVYLALYDARTMEGRSFIYPTDLAWCTIGIAHDLNLYRDKLNPISTEVQNVWSKLYRIVFDANTILARLDAEDVDFNSEDIKDEFRGEALFFRAFAYRTLGILYGGVPLVLNEVREPKRNFVRASRDEVWNQCVEDLKFAAANLPDIDNVREEGRVSQAAAYHLLAEVYLNLEEWDASISAASWVIDNPDFGLMTERFGNRANEAGDVYWDLFRRNNQNRTSGNREGIWVNQYEYLTPGGGTSFRLVSWGVNPFYIQLKDPDGVNLFVGPTEKFGGRPIGWYSSTEYMKNQIWEEDFDTDMRNSEFNIIRDIKADNPASAYYGQYIVESGAIADFPNTFNRWWSVLYAKYTPIGEVPDEFITNESTGLVNNAANESFTDHYIFRLAETYLLRAEAYLGKGETDKSADDINVVRARANASLALPGDISIDYILDERARELHWEELRVLTLMRLNKLVERVRIYNPVTGESIGDHQNLWPIPQREIETNSEAALDQNPGY